ncbi:MAG: 4-(cytidine 5'-diphospho)-2-C-methyl-D-erythritol kinase [Candidatus Bipolaricaulis sp.]|nr:4-(cytidine 5'-diphospho)-2-C-methyl-D-erythritol kinase [Candidatus Bipolaricaulis sp.]
MTVEVRAYAKLNLALRVRGRRADGYHEIDSIVQTIDLADGLRLRVAEGDAVQVSNDLIGLQGPDLAERAASALLAAKETTRDVEIEVTKRIPAGAGLGGGSSDAAAVLHHLDLAVPPRLPRDRLLAVAAGIGSDVPLFLVGGCVRVRGRGERLNVCPQLRTETFALLVPPVHCSTASVYAAWRDHATPNDQPCVLGENDLLYPALATHPALLPYHQAIRGSGGTFAGMSGSGAAFYAAFSEPAAAHRAAAALARSFPEAQVLVCRPTAWGTRRVDTGGRT